MSGTGVILYARFYSKKSGSYIETDVIPTSMNYQTDIRNFAGSLDISFEVNKQSEVRSLRSHDLIELFFILPNGREHQVGVGYLEDSVKESTASSVKRSFNGSELVAQLLKIPFAETVHFNSTKILEFASLASKGEYLGAYCKQKGLSPVVGIQNYSGKLRVSTDLTQTKGALLQQYADLSINLIYQNRLGQLVIYGGSGSGKSLGSLRKGAEVDDFRVTSSPSKVISEVVYFYSSAQADLDRNKVSSPVIYNDDPRVRGVIYQPTFRTFSSHDLSVFDTTPDVRMKQIAKSVLRRSNSYLSAVVASCQLPYFEDGTRVIAYEEGQEWTLISDEEEFESREYPEGVKQIDMILAGIHYSQSPDGLGVQLLFIEKGTLL